VAKPPRPRRLELQRLREGYPCLTSVSGARLAHAAGFCLEQQKHRKGVALDVRDGAEEKLKATFELTWPKVTEQIRKEWGDPVEATENGACGIAILLVDALTDYHIVHRSYRSTGIDYWLAKREDELLQNAARLEVSGIRRGIERMNARLTAKLKQTAQSDGTALPAIVIVIEFGQPVAALGRKCPVN
jgi:hypothetical protein